MKFKDLSEAKTTAATVKEQAKGFIKAHSETLATLRSLPSTKARMIHILRVEAALKDWIKVSK